MEVSLARLGGFAADFINDLPKTAGLGAYIVGLSGELGAGKTAFVQEVAKALAVKGAVTSPTFVLARRYPIYQGPFRHLVHIDAYRLSPEEDTFGWAEYARDPQNLILAEWPERLPGGIPEGVRSLQFAVVSEDVRNIEEKKT